MKSKNCSYIFVHRTFTNLLMRLLCCKISLYDLTDCYHTGDLFLSGNKTGAPL